MNIIVQKFGGTSLATEEKRKKVVEKILGAKKQNKSVIVVLSAMGRQEDPYATDTLKSLISNHYNQYSLKTMDLLMSCGEIISVALLSASLESLGENVRTLTGYQAGIITDNVFGNAEIISIERERLLSPLSHGEIVIVTGFQGITKDQEITTLGRGGSDTTAAALGAALGAEVVEIYTDVDGIMTADPHVVPRAQIIKEINYEEVFQMADKGAKVIHPRAIEIAKKSNIPLLIKNTMSDHPGTRIHHCGITEENLYSSRFSRQNLITAITHQNHVAQITVYTEEKEEAVGTLLSSLAEAGISIDMINFFIDRKVFTIKEGEKEIIKNILSKTGFSYEISPNCSKVTIIGNRIAGIPGVMAKIVEVLNENNIQIFQSSDSSMTISLLVKKEDVCFTVNVLHDAFLSC